jgi:uncharacterized membrane protein YhiD involved in acid resistance
MIVLPVMILRLVLAIVLGGIIGLEREFHEHRAGMRTNALVSLGTLAHNIPPVSSPLGTCFRFC